MKKLFLLTSILALQTITAQAQQEIYRWRAGLHGGLMYSINDIAPTPTFGKSDFVYGLSLERSFNNAWSGKLLFTQGQFTVNDRAIEKSAQFGRSLNAQTRIADVALMATYAFDNERNLSLTEPIAPYISAGLGLSSFNVYGDLYYKNDKGENQRYYYWDDNTIHAAPKILDPNAPTVKQDGEFETKLNGLSTEAEGNYPTTIINIPVALGVKFRLNDQLNLNLEAMTRFTNTDYLEDASGNFRTNIGTTSSQDLVLAAKPNTFYTGVRGDKNTQDIYGSLMLSLHYNFGLKTPNIDIDVPIAFAIGGKRDSAVASPNTITPIAAGKPNANVFTKDTSSRAQPIQIANAKTGARGGFTDFSAQYPLINGFKTRDTTSGAIAEIERMRLEVGYISKELTQLDTTKDNTKLVSDRFGRMTNIRTKVNDYRKYAMGSPDEQERIKTVLGDLQAERKDVVVSINMLMISTSDKSKIVDNLKKKESDNDGFIKRQEKRINELRTENGVSAIDLNALASAKKPEAANPKVEQPIKTVQPPVVAEVKPKVEQPTKPPVADTRGAGGGGEVKVAPKPVEIPATAPATVLTEKTLEEKLKQKEADFEKKIKERESELQAQMDKKEREMKEQMSIKEREMQERMAQREREMQAQMDKKLKEREEELMRKYGKSSEDTRMIQELAAMKAREAELEQKAKAAEAVRIAEEARMEEEARKIALANNKPVPAVIKAPVTAKKTEVQRQLEATKAAIAAKEAEKVKKQSSSATPNNQIWFIPNDSQLTPTQQARLKTVITFLQANPEMTIELKPFIEPGMKDPDLPYTRADAVKNFLIMQGNIDMGRIQVALAGAGAIQVGKRWVSGRRVDVRYIVQ